MWRKKDATQSSCFGAETLTASKIESCTVAAWQLRGCMAGAFQLGCICDFLALCFADSLECTGRRAAQ